MPEKFKVGCQRPKGNNPIEPVEVHKEPDQVREEKSMIQVGKPAPDFELSGYQNGEFLSFKLSEYKGKWVVLCFYPGDFTFV